LAFAIGDPEAIRQLARFEWPFLNGCLPFLGSFVMNFKSPFWLSVLSLALLVPVGLNAQTVDTSVIPSNAMGAFIFSLSKLKTNPELEDLPYEVISSVFESDYGLDVFTIEQGTLIVYPGEDSSSLPQFAFILKLTEKPTLEGRRIRDKEDEAGYKAKSVPYTPASVLVIDDTTLMVLLDGSEAKKFVDAKPGPLSKMIDEADPDSWDAFAVFDPKSIMSSYGDTIREGAKQIPFLPPAVAQLIPLLEELESAQASMQIEPYRFDSRLRFTDAATAAKASKKIKEAAELGAQLGVGAMAAQMDAEDPTQTAILDYSQRLIKEIPELPNFKANGRELTFSLKDEEIVLPVLAIASLGETIDSFLVQSRRNSRRSSGAVRSSDPLRVKPAGGGIKGIRGFGPIREADVAPVDMAEEMKQRLEKAHNK